MIRGPLIAEDIPPGKLPIDLARRLPCHVRGQYEEDPAVRAVALAIRSALLSLPSDEHRKAALSFADFCHHCGGDDAASTMNGGMSCQCSNDE